MRALCVDRRICIVRSRLIHWPRNYCWRDRAIVARHCHSPDARSERVDTGMIMRGYREHFAQEI